MSEGVKTSKLVAYSLLGPPELHTSKVVVYSLVSAMSIISVNPSDDFYANVVESGGFLKGPLARPLFVQVVDNYGDTLVDAFKGDVLPDYRRWCSESYGVDLQDYVATMLRRVYPVLPYPSSYPLSQTLRHDFKVNPFGDGYEQTISNEVARTRADGMGGVSSYYGLNAFTLQFNKMRAGADNVANRLWDFFRRRLENGNEPFYLYNPTECGFVIDTTTVSTTGRYLVRLEEPNQVLNREYYKYCLFNFGGIKLIEDRSSLTLATLIGVSIDDSMVYDDIIDTPRIKLRMYDDYTLFIYDGMSMSKVLKPVVTPGPGDSVFSSVVDAVSVNLVLK
jgi:hypothetical protein